MESLEFRKLIIIILHSTAQFRLNRQPVRIVLKGFSTNKLNNHGFILS